MRRILHNKNVILRISLLGFLLLFTSCERLFDIFPPEIEIISPSDGEAYYGSIPLEINAEDANFDRIEVYINGKKNKTYEKEYVKDALFLPPGSYTFLIKAFDVGGNWRKKEIKISLKSIELYSPSNGDTITDNTPSFDWEDVPGAVKYWLQVDNNSDFSSPEISDSTTASNFTATTSLQDNKYYWRVKAGNSAGLWGNWSSVWNFTIAHDLWTTKADMPTAREQFAIGVVNGKIYAIGGWTSWHALSTNEEYDPVNNTWTTKAPMPTARYAFAIGVVNGKIYVIGGSNGNVLSTNEAYDPATDSWDTTKAPMPTARSGLAIGVVNNKIYAIGGQGGGSANEEYDPATDSWDTTKAPMPTARSGLAIGVVNGKIYAIGGGQANEEYDPATDSWQTKASMPTARSELAIGVVNGKIYAIGGYYYDSSGHYLSTNEEYDPATNQWTTKAPMPTARRALAIGVVNNKIYAIGGYDGNHIFSTNEKYIP